MSDLYRLVIKDGGVQWTPEEVIGDLIDEGVLVPVKPYADEVWVSETFGAYTVVDENGIVVDTVTNVRHKLYMGAEIVGNDE